MPLPNFLRSPILLFGVLFAITLATASATFNRVIIDPGHGGKDDGTKWGGVAEKTLNLDVSKRVEALLKKKGLATVMTRRSDIFLSLENRAKIANRYTKNSIFISIHFNASRHREVQGVETFYYSPAGKLLASRIQPRLASFCKTRNRGVKKRALKVILHTKTTAVLAECGFISNNSERSRVVTEWYKNKVAEAIVDGIMSYRRDL